jgi:hypothetical protein
MTGTRGTSNTNQATRQSTGVHDLKPREGIRQGGEDQGATLEH